MNLYVIAEEFYNDMRIVTGALTYMEALKKSNEMKREFPNRNFNVIMHMPAYRIGMNYPKAK